VSNVLLLDDDDELPLTPAQGETTLAAQLGADGLRAIDATLQQQARRSWLKVARVVSDALRAGGFPPDDDDHIALHVRRLMGLVESGALEGQGNVRRPRWSEVRLPSQGS
jgi:hypothetical protein